MPDIIDGYLSRLASRLSRKLPARHVQDYVNEIREHLRESASARVDQGESEQASAIAALRMLGSDRAVAEGLIRARSGIDLQSSWRLALPILAAVILYVAYFDAAPFAYRAVGFSGLPHVQAMGPWMFIGFALLFAAFCWRSRRLLWAPLLATGALVLVAQCAIGLALGPVMRGQYLEIADRSIEQYQRDAALGDAFMKGHLAASAVRISDSGLARIHWNDALHRPVTGQVATGGDYYWAPKPTQGIRTQRFLTLAPWLAVTSSGQSSIDLVPVKSEAAALALWRRNGSAFDAKASQTLAWAQQTRAEIAKDGPQKFLAVRLLSVVVSSGLFLAILLSVNALALVIGRASEVAAEKAWRPERLAR